MITCKEDLINTAVFCKRGELRDLYIKKCEQLGIDWEHTVDINNYSFLYVKEDMRLQGVRTVTDSYYLHLKRLTLSDLKPRTKTAYEEVTESIFDLKEEFESGNLYWWYESDCKDKSEYIGISSEYDLMTYAKDGSLFRKVEKEIDWRDEVSDFVIKNKIIYSCDDHKHIKAIRDYTEEQFLEMCRVALRATGELE